MLFGIHLNCEKCNVLNTLLSSYKNWDKHNKFIVILQCRNVHIVLQVLPIILYTAALKQSTYYAQDSSITLQNNYNIKLLYSNMPSSPETELQTIRNYQNLWITMHTKPTLGQELFVLTTPSWSSSRPQVTTGLRLIAGGAIYDRLVIYSPLLLLLIESQQWENVPK